MKAAGSAVVTIEADGLTPVTTLVILTPISLGVNIGGYRGPTTISLPVGVTTPGSVLITSASSRRPGASSIRLRLRSTDAAVVKVAPAEFELSGSTLTAPFTLSATRPGSVDLVLESDQQVAGLGTAASINVREATSSPTSITELSLGSNLQIETTIGLNQSNANGVIASVTSSDPARLVVSRNATTIGTGSTTVAIQPGFQSGTVYLQSLASTGEATVTATIPGFAEQRWRVHLVPSWVTPRITGTNGVIGLGESTSLFATLEQDATATGSLRLRPGLGPLRFGIVSSEPGTLEFSSPALTIPDGADVQSVNVDTRGATLGSTSVRFDQPPPFGAAPSGRGEARVHVVPRTMAIDCSSSGGLLLARDTQFSCGLRGVTAGTVIEVVSSDPTRLLVSADSRSAGSGRLTLTTAPETRLTFQALAASGTVEVVLTSPGFSELRVPVMLRRTEVRPESTSMSIPRGGAANLRLYLAASGGTGSSFRAAARVGATIRVGLGAAPAGIVSFETPSVTFAPGAEIAEAVVRGVAQGTAVLVLTPPAGFAEFTGTPLNLVVP